MNEKQIQTLVDEINGSPQRVRELVEALVEIYDTIERSATWEMDCGDFHTLIEKVLGETK